jgi:hypothetical protein
MSGSDVGNLIQDLNLAGTVFPALSAASQARFAYMNSLRSGFLSAAGGAFVIALGFPLEWGAAAPAVNSFLGRFSYGQQVTEINAQISAPVTGSLFGFNVRSTDANFSATATFTVRKAAVNTALTVGVTTAVNNAVDSTHAVAVNRGDLLSVRITGLGVTNRVWAGVYMISGG